MRSDEITFSITSLPEFSLEIDDREQLLTEGEMAISGAIDAHNGLDLSEGGMLDIIIEPYNQALLDSAVITWGDIDANGDLTFSVSFDIDEEIPLHEYTIQLNVVTLDGGIAHAASVAFVTESSTLDGAAVAADNSVIVTGNTSQHDGTDEAAEKIANGEEVNDDSSNDDSSKSESSSDSTSSNTPLIIGSTVAVLGIVAGVVVVLLRQRDGDSEKMLTQQQWDQAGMQTMQQPAQSFQQMQPAQPVQQAQPMQPAQPVQQAQPMQPVQPTPAPMATAPPPPAQPTSVADYTGLPPGGTYDQSTGQTVYIQPDGVRWQMMPDNSFNRL